MPIDNIEDWDGKTPLFINGTYYNAGDAIETLSEYNAWAGNGESVCVVTSEQRKPPVFTFEDFLSGDLHEDFDAFEFDRELEDKVNEEAIRITSEVWWEGCQASRESLEKHAGKMNYPLAYEKAFAAMGEK